MGGCWLLAPGCWQKQLAISSRYLALGIWYSLSDLSLALAFASALAFDSRSFAVANCQLPIAIC